MTSHKNDLNYKLKWVVKFIKYLLLLISILYIGTYVTIAFFRIQYPFELEWMEGGSVDHVRRILSGKTLYVSPSLEFVPYIYTPAYFYLSAVLSGIIGVGFLPLRLLSFISSLGCFLIIFLIVKREVKSNSSGIIASGLFAATFRISGAWFDIARVDSLFLFMLLLAFYIIRFYTSKHSIILAGVLISLSFLTKQVTMIIALPIMLYYIFSNQKYSTYFVWTIILIVGVSSLVLDYVHSGWYTYYIFELPLKHDVATNIYVDYWLNDILLQLPIAFTIALLYLVIQFLTSKKNSIFYIVMTAGMLGGAWVSRLHSGGYDNVLFPAYAIISILFGLGTHRVFKFFQHKSKMSLVTICIYLLCIMQFTLLIYNPFDQIPTRYDLEAGNKFITMMRGIQGEVFVPYHGYLPTLAGKNSYAQKMAVDDVLRARVQEGNNLIYELEQALEEKRFSAIILDDSNWFKSELDKYYILQQQLVFDDNVFWPVTGFKTRPAFVYVPK